MIKHLWFTTSVLLEGDEEETYVKVVASVFGGRRGGHSPYGPVEEEPPEVDMSVSVKIDGKEVFVTDRLSKRVREALEEQCIDQARSSHH